jgi:dTDP-4-amino-4,6-dideoxygalactose transaminase
MIRLNESLDSNYLRNLIVRNVSSLVEDPGPKGGMFSKHINDTERCLSGILNTNNVVLTSSGTSALSLAIEYAVKRAGNRLITFFVSEYLYFSLIGLIEKYNVTVVNCQEGEEVQLKKVEPQSSHFNIFVVTGHNNQIVNKQFIQTNRKSCFIIEDRCMSFGPADSDADISCYSFSNNKMIIAGEGGCIATNYDVNDIRLLQFSNIRPTKQHRYFMFAGQYHAGGGHKHAVSAYIAAVIQAQLDTDVINETKEKRFYNHCFLADRLPLASSTENQQTPLFFVMKLTQPLAVEQLSKKILRCINDGVEVFAGVLPFSHFTHQQGLKYNVCLPSHPNLTQQDLSTIAKVTTKYFL